MAKKSIFITVRVDIACPESTSSEELAAVIDECNYDFSYNADGISIFNTEFVEQLGCGD